MRRLIAYALSLSIVLVWTSRISTVDSTLIAKGSVWKYLDNGSNQGTAWYGTAFNDSGWVSGAAQLGYGDGDEATVVSFGPNSANKYITTYFRRAFTVGDPTLFQSLTLNLLRDDGAVVYLNGTEVFRSNMPAGAVAYNMFASLVIGGAEESTFYTAQISPALLVAGTNVLAVEVHQANVTSSDISFDAELIASTNLQVTRGPYLQTGTPSSIVVRWRTGGASDSQVRYGLDPSSLIWTASSPAVTTEHQIALSSLSPATKYYYSVGSTTQTLAGADANHFFVTSPPTGISTPTRVWVLGDSGTADANAQAVRNAYYTFAGTAPPNVWLMLGDNAYEQGLDTEYQAAVFDMYPATLRQSVLWPTLGNHDGAAADSATQTGPYYDMFTLPTAGQAGGLASGTEAYYSFDYGDIHFICLESFETNRAANGPMMTWLQSDVASTTQKWVVAFWHHPPYTKGSHDSDTEIELMEMRQNALPILEAAGVDLVLTGHSHAYERSFLIDGHYGLSGTFTQSMKLNGGSGRVDGTGAYQKVTAGKAPHEGAVYAVAGSSGQISGGALNHPAMFVSLNMLGSMVLDITDGRLDAKFLDNTAVVRDHFTILKGSAALPAIAPQPTNQTVPAGQTATFTTGATGSPAPAYQWQVSTNGGGSWAPLTDTGPYGGTSTSTLTVTPPTVALNGYRYRVIATNDLGSATSSGAMLTVTAAPLADLVTNGTFGSGATGWQTFATPDLSYIVSSVASGVLQFSRVPPPPGTSNQATAFQETGVPLVAGAPLLAQFQLGNTSSVRKYMKVLVLDADFSDFAACTFWLPPNSALQTYQLKTHTTKPWTNAAIYFYAGTANASGDTGVYRVDNVSLQYVPAQAADRTDCVDPLTPMAPGGGAGVNMLTNASFGTGVLTPWTTFGTITQQITSGVLQMLRPSSTLPAGVVLQPTSQPLASGQILTATFQLGNNSIVRKRVTAIVHDLDFTDLVACVFWLEPGQPLATYSMVGWTSKAWTNATLSFYPATIGAEQWTLLDNVTYQTTPATATTGSSCVEPAGGGAGVVSAFRRTKREVRLKPDTTDGGREVTNATAAAPPESAPDNRGRPQTSSR